MKTDYEKNNGYKEKKGLKIKGEKDWQRHEILMCDGTQFLLKILSSSWQVQAKTSVSHSLSIMFEQARTLIDLLA